MSQLGTEQGRPRVQGQGEFARPWPESSHISVLPVSLSLFPSVFPAVSFRVVFKVCNIQICQ